MFHAFILDIKLKNYENALEDTRKCLEKDTDNIKALFRKAECLLALNRNVDAMDTYLDIMEIDSSNVHALKAYNDLSSQNVSSRKASGTRIKITDSKVPDNLIKLQKKEDDYAELIKPKKIVKNQFYSSVKNLSKGNFVQPHLKIEDRSDRSVKTENALIEEI